MRTLIVSDIHSNLVALVAVLQDAETSGAYQHVWCLGDTVGYGPEPVACVELLLSLNAVTVMGNHDDAAVGIIGTGEFNDLAAWACRWTADQLTPSARQALGAFPRMVTSEPFTLVHGAPRDPLMEYLVSMPQAVAAWEAVATPVVLVGHLHRPFVCREGEGFQMAAAGDRVPIENQGSAWAKHRFIINPGSVGQPRDGDPRAAYAVYDDEKGAVEMHRVPYDIHATQQRMRALKLPGSLINRLAVGH